jgi:hypothetical protein
MRITAVLTVIFCAIPPAQAQLTREQKFEDFQTMANQFAKRYVATSLKTTLFGVDLLDIKPFLDRVSASKDDLEFYDICVDYTAQLRDGGHVFFGIPSNFTADLNFRVDTFDGKPLVYSINRVVLPASSFPFQIGDELVSIDGKFSADLMASFYKYGIISNERTGAGYAAQALTFRPQSAIPHAIDVPDTSAVVIRRQSGDLETYVIPWTKTGVPLVYAGPVPSPSSNRAASKGPVHSADAGDDAGDSAAPLYSMLPPTRAVAGVGSLLPVFSPPAGFKIRLGRNANTDAFFSGTYQSNGYTIGFIRIPSFAPALGVSGALAQFDAEISFFRDNTDGLIVDDMRNPGGLVYYGEEIARRLTPRPIRFIGFELRSTREFVNNFSTYVQRAQAQQLPQYVIDYYNFWLDAVEVAYSQNGGHTGPVPLDTILLNPPVVPALDEELLTGTSGNPAGYSKPIIVLTDEFSFSGADYFPATMQDNNAATIFGMRTGGLGGTNASYNAGAYSEAVIGMLRGLMVRKNPISVPGFPTNNYIENVGVQPDIVEDYKTLDNLLNGGKTFVDHFTAALVNLIQQKK